jgi:hypothetical protein
MPNLKPPKDSAQRPNPQSHHLPQLASQLREALELEQDPLLDPPIEILKGFTEFSKDCLDFIDELEQKAPHPLHPVRFQYYRQLAERMLEGEWILISRACTQRAAAKYFSGHTEAIEDSENPLSSAIAFDSVFAKADKKAAEFYSRFSGYKVKAPPLVYMDKAYSIRRLEFTPFPIISMPYLTVYSEADKSEMERYSALAHEMGHFIYFSSAGVGAAQIKKTWNRLTLEVRMALEKEWLEKEKLNANSFEELQVLLNGFARLLGYWSRWQEELFADVCGTLLSGANFLETLFYILEKSCLTEEGIDPYKLTSDSGQHPMWFLRPIIAYEVLSWVLSELNDPREKGVHKKLLGYKKLIDDYSQRAENALGKGETIRLISSAKVVVKTLLEGDVWPQSISGDSAILMLNYTSLGELIDYPASLPDIPLPRKEPPTRRSAEALDRSTTSAVKFRSIVERATGSGSEGDIWAVLGVVLGEIEGDEQGLESGNLQQGNTLTRIQVRQASIDEKHLANLVQIQAAPYPIYRWKNPPPLFGYAEEGTHIYYGVTC